jgi:hypothetical protein
MAGQSAGRSTSSTMMDINATRGSDNGAGISGSQNSAIGGAGRKGASGEGSLADPMYTRIDSEVVGRGMNGMATGGTTGYDSGFGRTFSSSSRRKED